MVERRPGGESGIAAVQCLEGAAIWEAATAAGGDKWSRDLAVAAMAVVDLHSPGATNSGKL